MKVLYSTCDLMPFKVCSNCFNIENWFYQSFVSHFCMKKMIHGVLFWYIELPKHIQSLA